MPRRGWQAIEVPSGWYEVIRTFSEVAPCFSPPVSAVSSAVDWFRSTRASRGSLGPTLWTWEGWSVRSTKQSTRSPPEVALSAARQRVAKLEAALAALGDTGPVVTVLQSALKRAKQAAQEPPLDVQMSLCEQFVTSAQRRLSAHDEERTRLVSELEKGQSRLARLREAATVKEVPVPPCVIQPECGGHIAHLETNSRRHVRQVAGFCLSQTVWGTCLR